MATVLVRLLKRKTSLEIDAQSFIKTELTKRDGSLDLSLSVYQLDEWLDTHLTCTCAEHTAGNELDPHARACMDVAQTRGWKLLASPTQNKLFNFEFSSDAHREMTFNAESLVQFAEQLVLQRQGSHAGVPSNQNISVKDVTGYAYRKYSTGDKEWQEVCNLSQKVEKWVMKGEKT